MSGPQSSRGFIYSFNHLMFTEHLFFPLFFFTEHLAALACARRGGWVGVSQTCPGPYPHPWCPSSSPPQLSPRGLRYKDLPRPLAF